MNLNWKFSDKQTEADEAGEPYVLYGGAKGGGKSFWLCRWAFCECAENPGNKGYLGRKRGVDFNNTTLETWKKAVPSELYKINEQKKKIYLPNVDGVIDYGGMDREEDINRFNSAEYGFIGVDQAEEISRDDFSMLRGTLRHKLPSGESPAYKVRLTANPAQCWLKDDFILFPKEGHRYIQALPTDNPFLADGYIANLRDAFKHRPDLLRAYLEGSWDEISGSNIVIQTSWVEAASRLKPTGKSIKRVIVCDPAHFGDDETVIYVLEQRSTIEITDQEILNHKTTMDTAGRLMAKRKQFDASLIIVDSIGIGTGVVDRLNELDEPVLAIISSQRPTTSTEQVKYTNLRSQMWMEGGRKIFEQAVAIPNDPILKGQLSSVHYEFASNGRLKVEGKDQIKSKFNKSPDRADALLMGLHGLDFAERVDAKEYKEATSDQQGRGTPITNEPDWEYCFNEF